MNQSFQESNVMLVDVSEKLPAFREKLKLRKRKIVSQKTASFSVFNQFLEDMSFDKVYLVIERHLDSLIQEFDLIIIQKRQKIWCAIHLTLMLMHCLKAAKVFLNFMRNLVR